MATAILETVLGITGLSLTLDLYPEGSDTAAASGITLTEASNRKGLYTGTTTAGLSGMHQAFVKNGSAVFATGIVWMTNDTSVHRIVDEAAALIVQDVSGAVPSVTAGTNGGLPTTNASNQVNIAPSQIVFKKNTAFSNFPFFMNVIWQPAQGLTGITWSTGMSQVNIDAAGFINCTNLPTEIGNGMYVIDLTASELNGNAITLRFTASGADARILTLLTQP